MAWLSGWTYRRPITINNSSNSNALTDYQVLITLDTQSLISAGKMRSDGGDIRFTDSDGSTLLNYWIETGINTTSTKIWVKVPSIPASSTKTIYVYYGNPSATSQSNGSNTFIFFNDGSSLNFDSYLNLSGQDVSGAFSVDTTTFSFPTIKHTQATVNTYEQAIKNITISNSGTAIRAMVNLGALQDIEAVGVFLGYNGADQFYLAQIERYSAYTNGFRRSIIRRNNGGTLLAVDNPPLSANTWYNIELRWLGNALSFWMDGSVVLSATDNTFTSGYFGIHGDWSQGVTHWYYNILVRKYTSPEPTTSVGAEEQFIGVGARRLLIAQW
jgi:hypothetical protein